MKSYDRLGITISYSESYENLGIKGVQLETLGYLWVQHSIKWVNFQQFNATMIKQFKYLKFNSDEMGSNKRRACDDQNFN